jgi:predicted nucleic acid-binding protein
VIVIADTSPLQYAVEIDVAHAIFALYGRIVVPLAVASEVRHLRSVEVPDDPRLALLDPGEREALALAQQSPDSLLIIDDGEGRKEARRRGLRITGLLGVIRDAALRGHVDFEAALRKLMNTDFRLSPEVEALARQQYRDRSN